MVVRTELVRLGHANGNEDAVGHLLDLLPGQDVTKINLGANFGHHIRRSRHGLEQEEREGDECGESLCLNGAIRVVWTGIEEVEENLRGDGQGLLDLVLNCTGVSSEQLTEWTIRCGSVAREIEARVEGADSGKVAPDTFRSLQTPNFP